MDESKNWCRWSKKRKMNGTDWIVEVDQGDNLIGKIEREEAHNMLNLHWHREVMTILFTDETRTQFLMQHRSAKKKQLPGYWTLSVTGHVDFSDLSEEDSEGYLTASLRETMEEIGVSAKKLSLVGKLPQQIKENWAIMGIVVGEFEGELKLDPNEVAEVGLFDKNSITEISDKLTPGAKACLKYLNII